MEQIRHVARELLRAGPDEKRIFVGRAMDLIDECIARGTTGPFIISFSDDGRLPSQRKRYGDFSIAFDLQETSVLFGENTSVLKVTYEQDAQREIVSETFEAFWGIRQRSHGLDLRGMPEGMVDERCLCHLVSLLLTECVTFKSVAFKDEQEWRLVRLTRGTSTLRFRAGQFGITPYVELEPTSGQKLPIRRIILGPTENEASLRMLLKDREYADVEVEVLRC